MASKLKIRFLGTGTSVGIPMIACDCPVCSSTDVRDRRSRTSIMVSSATTKVVIDTGPDFRQQMLAAKVKHLDAVVFTHEHRDHTAGLDDIRPFNFFSKSDFNIYATERVQTALRSQFAYVFDPVPYPGLPKLILHSFDNESFSIGDLLFQPIDVLHYKLPVKGFRIGNFTYITDANFISEEEKAKVRGSEILVLNALRKEAHISHFTLDEAIALAEELGASKTYFTHLSHQMGCHSEVEALLPDGIEIAYDGLELELLLV